MGISSLALSIAMINNILDVPKHSKTIETALNT